MFDVDTGEQLREAALPGAELELSPDGTRLAVADGAEVVLVDAATLVELDRLPGHSDTIQDLRFSHDGTLLGSASADTTAAVWDAATGARLHVFEGHSGLVEGLAFSPDDRTLYTAGWDHLALDVGPVRPAALPPEARRVRRRRGSLGMGAAGARGRRRRLRLLPGWILAVLRRDDAGGRLRPSTPAMGRGAWRHGGPTARGW